MVRQVRSGVSAGCSKLIAALPMLVGGTIPTALGALYSTPTNSAYTATSALPDH